MDDFEPKPHKMNSFDEHVITLFKELSERNNELAALCQQEDEARIKLINLKKSIHELKKGEKIKITDILVPMGGFFRFLKISEKDEFIKHHMDTYNNIENQYMGICGQRVHREDEFGECSMRVLKKLWSTMRYTYKFTDEELLEKMKDTGKPNIPLIDEKGINNTIEKALKVKN